MLKRSLPLGILFCFLVFIQGEVNSKEFRFPVGQDSFPPAIQENLTNHFPDKSSLLSDMTALISSYPGFCKGLELGHDHKLYLIMKNQMKVVYDDGRKNGFEEKLDKPDLKDMLSQLYKPGSAQEPFRPDYDPGRFRVDDFFNAVYGASPAEVNANLVKVSFCGTSVAFNAQNGAAKALEKVGRELLALVSKRPHLRQYLFPLGGTFNWRSIAGTSRRSPHSWGICIDLNPRHGAYWRGRKLGGLQVEELRNSYPQEIVEVFEKHGFIWGGKWSHFDLMHFEYRPELFQKWRLAQGTQRDFQ